jgi:chorismate-pyruvate lyase
VKFNANLAELDALVGLFYSQTSELGKFESVDEDRLPEPQRSLLSHDFHMTVTVEKFHSSPVVLKVLQEETRDDAYIREIQLVRQSDGQLVQYGIVRLNFRHLQADVQREIRNKSQPLGRILIEHDVLRRVELLSLYRIEPSDRLTELMNLDAPETCFGRTAIIYCNDQPAIELLEIVRV